MNGVDRLIAALRSDYPFLTVSWARRMFQAYGTEVSDILGAATSTTDLGRDFGETLFEAEVRWLIRNEFAHTAEDVVWRRSRLGLRLTAPAIAALDQWMLAHRHALGSRPAAPVSEECV